MRIFVAILVLFGLLMTGCSRMDLSQEMHTAVEFAKHQQYAEAKIYAQRCLDYAPDLLDAVLLYNYCVLMTETRESAQKQALYNFSKATKTHPERYDAWLFYGWALVDNRQYRDAIEPLETAFKLAPQKSPHRARIQLLLGQCYVNTNLQAEALRILQPLKGKSPYRSWPELYNCLGLLARRRQDARVAISFFQRGLQLAPGNEALLQNLAVTYDLDANDPTNARKTYIKLLAQKKVAGTEESLRIQRRIRRLSKR